ncbi:MAG: SIMPL domain-containing protein [Bacteriovoracaceae bacterium]
MNYLTLSLLLLLALSTAYATEKTVTVSGECSHYITSDRGSLIMTVENVDKNVKVANSQTSETYAALKTALEKMNLKDFDLETTEYSVYEHKVWENNKNVSKGYKSRMGLKLSTSEIAKLGDVMVIANKHSVTEIGSLQSYVSDEKMKGMEIDCLKEASLDAKKKAEALAMSLGAKIDGILSVSEANISNHYPQPVFAKSMAMSGGSAEMASPDVAGGKEKYTLKIQTTFKLE